MSAASFGRFSLDLESHELRRDGLRVRLQPRPARVLALLVERAGAIVSHEEIRRHVWGETTWVDFDHNLRLCIHQVRAALNDGARNPSFIETVAKQGYRFLAPVTRSEAALAPVAAPAASRARVPGIAAVAVLLVGLLAGTEPGAAVAPVVADGPPAFLRGLYLRQSGPSGLPAAALAFEEAALAAPERADVSAAAAETWVEIADLGLQPAREALGRAETAARRALRIDPRNGRAHVALGTARLAGAWDWEGARASFARGLALEPGLVGAHTAWAAYLSATGDQAGALRAIARARELDPVCSAVRGETGWYYYCAGRFEDAAGEWRRALEIDPQQAGAHERLVRAYRHAGLPDRARAEALETLRLVGIAAPGHLDLDHFLAGTAQWLASTPAPGPDALERRAALYASLGERESALAAIEAAARVRSRFLLRHLAADPDLAPLRAEPRFQALLRSVGYDAL